MEVYGNITKMSQMITSESFKSKMKIIGNTPYDGNKKDVEMIVLLKYLKQFLDNS